MAPPLILWGEAGGSMRHDRRELKQYFKYLNVDE